jgi:alpha-mannosidase
MNIFLHDYSYKYSEYLLPLRQSDDLIRILEIGILKGTGLAIWSEYFLNKKIYGFDYDLGNFEINKKFLIDKGAFKDGLPTLAFFDQFADNSLLLQNIFKNTKLDVVIDDAFHSDSSILNTFKELEPYLSKNFVYFIEDNSTVHLKLMKLYPNYDYCHENKLTVITSKML